MPPYAETQDYVSTLAGGEPAEPAAAPPAAAPARGRYSNALTGELLNDPQSRALDALAAAGKLKPTQGNVGTEAFPRVLTSESDVPEPGSWYVTLDGQVKQAPGGDEIGPVLQPWKDLTAPGRQALKNLGREIGKGAEGDPMALAAVPLAGLEGVANQITGPASRALAKYGPDAYEAPAAPWAPEFGEAPKKLEGNAAVAALKRDLDLSMMAMRAGAGGFKPLPAGAAKALPPELRAARAIKRAQQRDLAAGPLPAVAPGAMPIHQGGENLVAVADVLASSPGPGRRFIRQAIRDHEATSSKRVKADIGTELGGTGDYLDTLDGLVAARKTAANEGMSRIEGQLVTLDNDSVMALRSDLAKGAIKERALNALASPDPAIRNDGARLMQLSDDLLDKPGSQTITVRDAQDISRSLLEGAKSAYAGGNGARGGALKDLGKAIRNNATTPERGGHGEYGDWLKQYGDDMANEEILDLGRNIFAKDNSAAAVSKQLAETGETGQALFRKGVGEALLDRVRQKGDVVELRALLKNEEFGDRVRLAFPDEASFTRFMESAARRVAERDVNSRIMGGSPTDPRQAARADLQGGDGIDLAGLVADVFTGNFGGLAKRGSKAALKAIPWRSRGAVKSVINDPEANLAASKAMMDEQELQKLLSQLKAGRARRARLAAIAGRAAPPLLETGAASPEGQK